MSTIVTYNKGAQVTKPDEHYAQSGGTACFTDFNSATPDGFTNTGSAVIDGAYGSSLYLNDADEIEYAGASELFKPRAGVDFAGKSRTKIVWGASDTTTQQIGFLASSVASPAEDIAFSIATSGATASPAMTITCRFDTGATDSSETLTAADLPDGFDVDAWHEYAILVETDSNDLVVAKYFIDGELVKTIKVSGVGDWAAAGLVWCQTNLTASSTHDQAIDWISLGSSYRPA